MKRPYVVWRLLVVLLYVVFLASFFNSAVAKNQQEINKDVAVAQSTAADTATVFDDFGSYDIDLTQLELFEQENNINPFALRLTPDVLARFLRPITEPLWRSTKAPSGRDILYLLPHKIIAIEYGGLAVNLFFNMTDQMHVTARSLFDFESALSNDDFQDLIKKFIDGASDQDVAQLLPLFEKITLQERKSGALMQVGFVRGPFVVQLNTSLQIGARNFWLNPRDQAAIKDTFKELFPGSPTFNEKELYKIRFGMGDTRVKFGMNTINMTSFKMDLGFESILPTSRLSYTPKVHLGLAQTSFDQDDLQKSGLATLRGIRDYLLNPSLGNNGHFGFGCYLEGRIGIFHEMAYLLIRLSHDVLFSNDEDRLFMFKKTVTTDDLDKILSDVPPPEDVQEQIITDYIRQYIFPSSFKASVRPGGVTNFVFSVNADFNKRLRGALGYDFYAQKEERITNLHNTNIDLQSLRVDDAQALSVRQHKFFSEVLYHNKKRKSDWGVGVGGDLTVSSVHLGKDWTLYLKIATSF